MSKLSPKKYRIQKKQEANHIKSLSNGKDKQLTRQTRQILRQGNYMYIDINQQEGFKLMNECQSSDDEQEVQKISKKFVINLNDFNTTNYKSINYMYKLQQENKKRKRTLNIIKQELQRSFQKIEEMNRPGPNSTRYTFLIKRDKSINKSEYQFSPQQTQSQLSKKMNSRLYHSYRKSLDSTFNFSTLQTERSVKESRKQGDQIHLSSKRLKMLLPSIKRDKNRAIL